MHDNAREFIATIDNMSVINVTEAAGAATGNGHAYFRQSPWASSDILVTLMYGLHPEERGLVRSQSAPVWSFPADYVERLRAVVLENYQSVAGAPGMPDGAH